MPLACFESNEDWLVEVIIQPTDVFETRLRHQVQQSRDHYQKIVSRSRRSAQTAKHCVAADTFTLYYKVIYESKELKLRAIL
jgi:hypothetical protein